MQQELEQIGLTTNEAKVYLALLDLGQVGAGEIVKKTGFHRSIVYESLDHLLTMRLVVKVIRKKVAQFQVSDPSRLVDEARVRLDVAEQVAEQVKKRSNVRSDIVIYDGIEGYRSFWQSYLSRMEAGDTYYVFGSLGDLWTELLGPEAPKMRRLILKKKIKVKVIAFAASNKDVDFMRATADYETRVAPTGQFSPANALIWKDTISLQTGVEPYSVIDIKNPALAQAYLGSFHALWEESKPLTAGSVS